MRYGLGVAVVSLFVFGCTEHDGTDAADAAGRTNPAVDAVFADYDAADAPGCAVAVARQGELLYARGYGSANLDYEIPIEPDTVFDVASVTKQFVSASINMLALEGTLSLDDDVRTWLPELPDLGATVTLRHMLYHTSGLRDYLNLFPLAGRSDHYPISHPQILAMMARQRALVFEPGERYLYSNTAFMLLAQVVERASGQSIGEFTRERIFEPLGMDGSRMYDNLEAVIPRRSTGYDRNTSGGFRVVHNYNFDVAGDGQLYTTVKDLLRWDSHLHDSKPAYYNTMLTEGRLNDGSPISRAMGLFLDDYRGLATVEHSGSSWGFRTQLRRFIEPGLAIAIACNSDYARPGDLAYQVADIYLADLLGPEEVDEPESSDDDSADAEPFVLAMDDLGAFVGEYFSPELDAIYRFSIEGESLVVRIEQEPAEIVTPVAEDAFTFDFYPQGWAGPATVELAFDRNPGGTVTGFRLSLGSEKNLVFKIR